MRNLLLPVLLLVPTLVAQTPSSSAPSATPAPIISPEVLPDHRAVFRLRAPRASEVTVAGDFWVQQNRTEKLVKDADGVWSLTTEPLPPDQYSYWFTVDGVRMPDPANGQTKPGLRTTQSAFTVPGAGEYYLEPNSVPHGEVRMEFYQSAVTGKLRRMHVYLPPGYEEGKTRYPVAYLFHGGGEEDYGWVTIGRVNFILDNLIAEGKAKPMVVVMPSLWAFDPDAQAKHVAENEAMIQKTVTDEVIPYVENHFRVLPGPANRAVGGLGIGRGMLPDFIWPTLGQFDSVLFVSGGTDPDRFDALQTQYPGRLDDQANVKKIRFFLGDGRNDASMVASKKLAMELKSRGYNVTSYETNGTHGWPSFRRCFAEWAQGAFK